MYDTLGVHVVKKTDSCQGVIIVILLALLPLVLERQQKPPSLRLDLITGQSHRTYAVQ